MFYIRLFVFISGKRLKSTFNIINYILLENDASNMFRSKIKSAAIFLFLGGVSKMA